MIKLCKYNYYNISTGAIDGTEKKAFAYFNSTSIPSDYTDFNTIENLDTYGNNAADYSKATFEMWLLFDAKTGATETDKWNNCTSTEKPPLAKRQIITNKNLRLEVFTESQDQENFFIHANESISARQGRIDASVLMLGYEIEDIDDRKDLFSDTELLIPKFTTVNDKALIDYMNGQNLYLGEGFPAKSYFQQATLDSFNDICINGNY
jgi:hypothetical protein